jgi:hypothetical protein
VPIIRNKFTAQGTLDRMVRARRAEGGSGHNTTLKQAALANGVSEELFDRVVKPLALTRPGTADVPSNPGEA